MTFRTSVVPTHASGGPIAVPNCTPYPLTRCTNCHINMRQTIKAT